MSVGTECGNSQGFNFQAISNVAQVWTIDLGPKSLPSSPELLYLGSKGFRRSEESSHAVPLAWLAPVRASAKGCPWPALVLKATVCGTTT